MASLAVTPWSASGCARCDPARYPDIFQHLADHVRDGRKAKITQAKNSRNYAAKWWRLSEARTAFRRTLVGLDRFIVSSRTSRHRVFQFCGPDFVPETKVLIIALRESWQLGVLSSRIHVVYAIRRGGWHGVGNDPTYNHTECFDPFPFPAGTPEQVARIGALAEALDQHRKRQKALHPALTLTDTYNVLATLRSGEPLKENDKIVHEHGLVSVLKQIHDDLDAAVCDAYGWPSDLPDDQTLERLVALNAVRAAEESAGLIRWLRPDFQTPAGRQEATQATFEIEEPEERKAEEASALPKAKIPWPKSLAEQAQAVRTALAAQRGPVTPAELAKQFQRARLDRVEDLLDTLVSLGQARDLPDGRFVAGIIGRSL